MGILISNEYRTCSLSTPAVLSEANAVLGCDRDPLELLMDLEGRASQEWQSERSIEPKQAFVDRYIRLEIDNL